MYLLSVLGLIFIVVGVLGLLNVIGLSLAVSIILIVAGLLLIVIDNRGRFTRAGPPV